MRSVILSALTLGVASVAVSSASAQTFNFPLSGTQEVPSFATPATGTGSVTLSGGPGAWVANYTVTYSGLTGAIASPFAHIHNAPAGSNGGVVHDLDGANIAPIAGSTSGTIVGDWRFNDASQPLTDTLANQMIAGNLYFNIHTTARQAGEIRGQIVPEPTVLGLIGAASAMLLRRRK
jgi:CHRD domain